MLQLRLADPIVEIELGQRLLDKVEAAQVRVAGCKVGKGSFVEQPAQQPL